MKIGDKVKIREDLVVGKEYGYESFVDEMNIYKGKIATILDYKDEDYLLDIDDKYWNWSEEMLEKITIEGLQKRIVRLERRLNKARKELEELQKEPILDDIEKEYLKAVIKPFKNKIKYIQKGQYKTPYNKIGYEWIAIVLKQERITFPVFEKGTMYKGMEVYKHYTLKELGLD